MNVSSAYQSFSKQVLINNLLISSDNFINVHLRRDWSERLILSNTQRVW